MAVKKETENPAEMNPAELQAQIAKMLEQAKEEAQRIVEEARTAAKGEMSAEEKAEREKRKEYWNELVEVKLFKDNSKYKDDVFVSVNGDNCLIKRGERVKIKRKFAEVLEQSDMQDAQTARLIESAMEVKKVADM